MKIWDVKHAVAIGAVVGFVAALFKLLAPWSGPHSSAAVAGEIAAATLGFALLCGFAAALRNFLLRRFGEAETDRRRSGVD